jgi:hypothetical protein
MGGRNWFHHCYEYEWVLKKKRVKCAHPTCGPVCESAPAVYPSGQYASPQAGYSSPQAYWPDG